MEKQDILDYVSKTPENVNVNVLGGMLDEFASGGGGSSDFSIAHVTLINTAQDGRFYTAQCLRILGEYMEFGSDNIQPGEPWVVDVVLYKGEQYMGAWDWDTSIAPVITGDITYNSDNDVFIITGDGSISLVGTARIV